MSYEKFFSKGITGFLLKKKKLCNNKGISEHTFGRPGLKKEWMMNVDSETY